MEQSLLILKEATHLMMGCKSNCINSKRTYYSIEDSTEIKQHVKSVENGLLPVILVKGAESRSYNIYERMKFYQIPGVSIGVINDGVVEWAKGYGTKEKMAKDDVTVETIFQAASISKPITATAVLQLVEKNKIHLESTVNSQLKSWRIPENKFTQKSPINVKMLVLHTGGVSGAGYRGYAPSENLPTLLQILDGSEPANSPPVRVDIEPGSRWRYSGGGYLILQQLIADVTGISFSKTVQGLIFEPLGMINSTFCQPLPPEWEEKAAVGHKADGSVVQGRWHVYPEMAAGGLWTNPSDLCKFIIEIQRSLTGNSNKILSQTMTENMLSRYFENMGLGFVLRGQGDNLAFTFNGGNEGYRCDLFAYARNGKGAVIMTNSDNGQYLINEVYRSISAEYGWPDHKPQIKEMARIDKRIYEDYIGIYHSKQEIRPDFNIEIEKENDLLYLSCLGQRFQLIPESEEKFFNPNNGWIVEFVKNETGKVKLIRYCLLVGPGTAERIK